MKTLACLLTPCLALALSLACKGKDSTATVPVVSSCTPATFLTGSQAVLAGSGFADAVSVNINGVFITDFTVNSDTRITCQIPSTAITGPIAVSTKQETGTSTATYAVIPQITGLNPTAGAPGSTVVLTGSGFVGATQLLFGTETAGSDGHSTFTVDSANQITAIIGINATSATPSLAASGLSSIPTADSPVFTVTAPH